MSRLLTGRRIALALSLLLVAVLGTGAGVGYLTFLRAPVDPPTQVCAEGAAPTRPVIVAAGASLTRGTLGASWVDALRPRFPGHTIVNAGVNGDRSAGLLTRVDTDVVACLPDAVLLLIGTNDVRDEVPLDQYRDNLAAVVERISSATGARIALMSLPPLGEDLDSDVNHRLAAYNAVIAEIAARSGADHLPVHERLAAQLTGERPAFAFSFALALRAGAEHYLLGRSWDEVARGNGLELFVDHIHLSERAAAEVTELAARWLADGPVSRADHP